MDNEIIKPDQLKDPPKKKSLQPKYQARKNKIALRKRAQEAVKLLGEGKSLQAAGLAIGYSASYADTGVRTLLKNPTVVKSFSRILDDAGVTDPALADKLNQLLKAKKAIVVDHSVRQVSDNATQLGALTLATKLKGHLIDRSLSVSVDAGFVDLTRYCSSGGESSEAQISLETDDVITNSTDQKRLTTSQK